MKRLIAGLAGLVFALTPQLVQAQANGLNAPKRAATSVKLQNVGTAQYVGTCQAVPTYDTTPTTSDCPAYSSLALNATTTAPTTYATYVGAGWTLQLQRASDGYWYSKHTGPKWVPVGQSVSATYKVHSAKLPTSNVPQGPTGTWRETFSDEFSGTSVDTTKWTDKSSSQSHEMQGNKGNGQLEWNQMANCSVANGVLTLAAKRGYVNKFGVGYDWTSCLLTTGDAYTFQYGFVEIRSKQPPCNSGLWPAFWTWQAPGANTQREVDVYEYWPSWAGKCQQFTNGTHGDGMGGSNQSWLAYPAGTTAQAFNTYGADIKPTGTDFYLNGQLVRSVSNRPDGPMSIIVNVAVWADVPPPASSNGDVKLVDYVRAWQR